MKLTAFLLALLLPVMASAQQQLPPRIYYNDELVELSCRDIKEAKQFSIAVLRVSQRNMTAVSCIMGEGRCIAETIFWEDASLLLDFLDRLENYQCKDV